MTQLDPDDVEALAFAIEHGFADPREANDWACRLVVELAAPSVELIELAGLIRPHPLDVVGALRRLPGARDQLRVFRKVVARLRDVVRTNPGSWVQATRLLEQMALEQLVPESVDGECKRFEAQRCVAEGGMYGDIEDVRAEVGTFLEVEAEPSTHSALRVSATRLVDPAQPGWVECELIDAEGVRHFFVEKVPIVSTEDLNDSSIYPRPAVVACEIVGRAVLPNGRAAVEVDTERPFGIQSTRNLMLFVVSPQQLVTSAAPAR